MSEHTLSIAVTATSLFVLVACERDRTDDSVRERDTLVDSAGVDDRPTTESGERLSPEMQRRLDVAQERYDRLERRAADAARDLQARGGEIRSELDADVERARANARAKLDAARRASAANARRALDEVEAALADLDKRLGDHGKT